MMDLEQAKARLALVRAAIDAAIVGGGTTSYSIRGRSKTVDLGFLQDEERRLEGVIAMLADSGSTTLARFVDL